MSRIKGFTVTLEHDLQEEDFERIKDAVLLTKGVLDVTPVETSLSEDHMVRIRIRNEFTQKLFKLIKEL